MVGWRKGEGARSSFASKATYALRASVPCPFAVPALVGDATAFVAGVESRLRGEEGDGREVVVEEAEVEGEVDALRRK